MTLESDAMLSGVMSLGYQFDPLPRFVPGETVLHLKPRVWAISSKSPPSYRLFFSLPPLTEVGLYLTDRRIMLVAGVARLLWQQFSLWFPGQAAADAEMFKGVDTGTSRLGGSYLELTSEDSQSHWYRSCELRLRLFMRKPEALESLICRAAGL